MTRVGNGGWITGESQVTVTHILIQAEAGTAAIVTAALRGLPGISETASVAGPADVTARAGTRDTGELAELVTPRARTHGGGVADGQLPDVRR
jgi:hypothetical protein